jgi:AcrR family transcriptional regulator
VSAHPSAPAASAQDSDETVTLDRERALQRARIIDATVAIVAEHGLAATSVAKVIARARVSRRTFQVHFDGLEAALFAVIDDALAEVSALVRRAFGRQDSWRASVRQCLADVLLFFDERPALARVLLVETLTGNPAVVEHRQDVIGRFRALVVEQIAGRSGNRSPLAAEGALASVMGIVYARLVDPQHPPLIDLTGPLMGVLAAAGSDVPGVADEVRRGADLARTVRPAGAAAGAGDALAARDFAGDALPRALRDPRSFRARQCLVYVTAHPGASNRQIGDGIGLAHRGQLSTLLRRLSRLDLLAKVAGRPGQANSWHATARGRQVAEGLNGHRICSDQSCREGFTHRGLGRLSMTS